jgi:transcriptional regulator with XRE-family HTH domain
VRRETEDAKLKQLQVLQRYNVTMNDLEEYRRNKPLIDYIKKLEEILEEVEKEKTTWLKSLLAKSLKSKS